MSSRVLNETHRSSVKKYTLESTIGNIRIESYNENPQKDSNLSPQLAAALCHGEKGILFGQLDTLTIISVLNLEQLCNFFGS